MPRVPSVRNQQLQDQRHQRTNSTELTMDFPNTHNAKLAHREVQQIRALGAAGFTARSIAPHFDLCTREVSNILKHRAWYWLPVEQVPLPIFAPDAATKLKLRAPKRLNA